MIYVGCIQINQELMITKKFRKQLITKILIHITNEDLCFVVRMIFMEAKLIIELFPCLKYRHFKLFLYESAVFCKHENRCLQKQLSTNYR